MHKQSYIQLYQGGGLLGGVSSLFSGLFGKRKANPLNGLDTSIQSGIGMAGMGSDIKQGSSNVGSSSFFKSGTAAGIGSGVLGGLTSAFATMPTTGADGRAITDTEKNIDQVSSITNGVTNGLMSSGVPVLMGIGAGLKGLDAIGGKFIGGGTSKAVDNFKLNQDVAASGGYSGIVNSAQDALAGGKAFKSAGLFGKLASNQGKIKNNLMNSNNMQSGASQVVKNNNLAMDSAASSAGMFQNNLIQKNYNSGMWNNGSVLFGAKGTKIHIKKSHEGKFTEYKKRTGKTTEEALHSSDPHVRKMANFAKNAAAWKHQQGGILTEAGSNATRTFETWKKLGQAARKVNLTRMKNISAKVPKSQQGGQIPFEQLVMQQDHTNAVPFNTIGKPLIKEKFRIEDNEDHGYTKWLNTLPQRLRGSSDYDLRGYFDKYGAVGVTGDMHLTDEFKKPNHVTFSKESKYSNDETPGGEWRQKDGKWEFVPSPWNIKNVGLDSLQHYFKENEPSARLVIPTHEEGGAINVIADGALHSRKHKLKEHDHLEDANITLKGIPVVSVSDGGEIKQSAEVEKDELILHYDLTKKLEELHKEGTDEAAIKAGRLLAREIVKNTRDSKKGIIENA